MWCRIFYTEKLRKIRPGAPGLNFRQKTQAIRDYLYTVLNTVLKRMNIATILYGVFLWLGLGRVSCGTGKSGIQNASRSSPTALSRTGKFHSYITYSYLVWMLYESTHVFARDCIMEPTYPLVHYS